MEDTEEMVSDIPEGWTDIADAASCDARTLIQFLDEDGDTVYIGWFTDAREVQLANIDADGIAVVAFKDIDADLFAEPGDFPDSAAEDAAQD